MDFSQYLRQHLLFISDKRLLSGMSPALPAILPYIQYNIENSAKAIFLQMVLYLLDFVYTDVCHRSSQTRYSVYFSPEKYPCVLMCSEIRDGLAPADRLSLLLVYLA